MMDLQGTSEKLSEHTIEPSGQIVLECSGCGEHLTLLGSKRAGPRSTGTPLSAARAVTRSTSPIASTERPTPSSRC
jgi:hypothetical protein